MSRNGAWRWWSMAAAAAAVAAPACSLLIGFNPEGQPCDGWQECARGFACVGGRCLRATGPDGCGGCDAGRRCRGGSCVEDVCRNRICPVGQGCVEGPDGTRCRPVEPPALLHACGADDGCVQRLGDYLRITIGGDVVFPQNRSELADMSPVGRARLEALAQVLRSPAVLSNIDQIHIVGHTSSEGTDERNWRLSSARAGTIALFLITQGRLPACKVTALGRGRFYPIHPDSARRSAAPDPADRRIEVEIRPRVVNDSAQDSRARDCVEHPGRAT
jgi:outer membrane protein OmpA-like peptidoglycan-associated protein